MFKPVKSFKGPLYENVAIQIESLIKSQRLKAGYKLAPERELAEILGVSRPCIREAVKALSAKGMLSVEHGRGVFVCEHQDNTKINEEQLLKQILWTNPKDMQSLFEIRRLIEPQGAAWAAQRCLNKEARDISCFAAKASHKNAGQISIVKLWELDTKFHISIAMASHNPILVRIIRSMLDLMAESRKHTWLVAQRPIKSLDEHRLIAQAIINKDPYAASENMMTHVSNIERDFFKL